MKVAPQHPDVWPEHEECRPDVDFEVSHEEAVGKVVGQSVLVKVVPDEAKEDVVGFSGFVRQEGNDAGDIDASQERH